MTTWLIVLSLLLAAALVERSTAQAKPPAKPAAKPAAGASTLAGVYTTAQAARGEETYFNTCVGCHPVGTYTGSAFKQHWGGKPLLDLYVWVSDKMPKNDPGTLTPKEAAQVVAFILKLNRMPPGKTELPANPAALRKIRVELK